MRSIPLDWRRDGCTARCVSDLKRLTDQIDALTGGYVLVWTSAAIPDDEAVTQERANLLRSREITCSQRWVGWTPLGSTPGPVRVAIADVAAGGAKPQIGERRETIAGWLQPQASVRWACRGLAIFFIGSIGEHMTCGHQWSRGVAPRAGELYFQNCCGKPMIAHGQFQRNVGYRTHWACRGLFHALQMLSGNAKSRNLCCIDRVRGRRLRCR
jgi:hypothetical protein